MDISTLVKNTSGCNQASLLHHNCSTDFSLYWAFRSKMSFCVLGPKGSHDVIGTGCGICIRLKGLLRDLPLEWLVAYVLGPKGWHITAQVGVRAPASNRHRPGKAADWPGLEEHRDDSPGDPETVGGKTTYRPPQWAGLKGRGGHPLERGSAPPTARLWVTVAGVAP